MRVLRKKERNRVVKNWKAKLSMLMVLCLILTGSHGLVLSADAQEEQGGSSNRIESRGENVKLHFKGEDLRQAAGAAIYEGIKFSLTESLSYSRDQELLQLYRDSLAEGKELYEISLDNFVVGTEEVYQETGAKVRAIVEIDPTERGGEIEKQGKDALGFFAKDSSFGRLMEKANPVWYEEALAAEKAKEKLALEESEAKKAAEEAKAAQEENAESAKANTETEKEEVSTEHKSQEEVLKEVENAKAPDFINLDAKKENYVVQGTELIHFVYENHGDKDLRFQLFVDSNSYPSVKVQSREKVAKAILEEAKALDIKHQKKEEKLEVKLSDTENQGTDPVKLEEENTEKANTSVENSGNTEVENAREEKSAEELSEKQGEDLANAVLEAEASKEEKTEKSEDNQSSEEVQKTSEEAVQDSQVAIVEGQDKKEEKKEEKTNKEDPVFALYQEMRENLAPFLSELYTAKYQVYSLNELGRKSQHKEVEDFGVVEVFYDKEAFPEAVTLQVSKRVKPEEAKGDEEELSAAQVEALKARGYYEDSRSIDIHFVNAEGEEVEPVLPVAVRLSISKDVLPEEAKPENISIHHLVETEGSDKIAYVETVSDSEKNRKNAVEENAKTIEESTKKEETGEEIKTEEKAEEKKTDESGKKDKTEKNAYIVREFNVKSFSVYTISWSNYGSSDKIYKFYYLDGDFRQIGPSLSVDMSAFQEEAFLYQTKDYPESEKKYNPETGITEGYYVYYAYPNIPGYERHTKVYPSYKALEEIKTGKDRDDYISWGNEVYFMSSRHVVTFLNYDYYEKYLNRNWGALVNMTTWDSKHKDPYYPDRDVCANYYYFFYKMDPKAHTHTYPEKKLEMKQEKYITRLDDGSYDITLTARPVMEGGQKNKLDVIFVYDKSFYMGFPYNDTILQNETVRPAYDRYTDADNDSGTKHYIGKLVVDGIINDLSKSPAYDAQFALVAMGGQRKVKYKVDNAERIKNEKKIPVDSIEDEPYKDAEKLIGFTKDVSAFNAKLNSIKVERWENGGLNYAAGLKEAVAFQEGATVGSNTQSIRPDARRVVIFITSYDPNFSYFDDYANRDASGNIKQIFYFLQGVGKQNPTTQEITYSKVPGKVEDTAKIGGGTSALPANAYTFTANFKNGYSYGSGRGFEESALTQARAELRNLNGIDAFFTVGLGPEDNYEHLKDLYGEKLRWFDKANKDKPLANSIEQDDVSIGVLHNDDQLWTKLGAKKNEIRNKIAPVRINEVLIKDRLSENVELNFDPNDAVEKAKKLRGEIWKLDAQGKPIEKLTTFRSSDGFSGFEGIEVNYDPSKRAIELTDKGEYYSFPKDVEYHLTVNVKPTIKAYEKYQKNFMDYFDKESERLRISQGKDIGYLDNVDGDNLRASSFPLDTYSIKEGDLRTDQWYLYQKNPEEKFHTSSQKVGFYSNEGAYLQYKIHKGKNQNEEPKNKYQKPVVQIEPASLRVVKTFQGTNSSTEELELLKNTSFLLEEEKVSGSGNFEEVKRFSMTKSETDSSLGYLVSEELKGTKLSGTGKNLTPVKPDGTLQTVMNGGMKQYVLSINGLVPGRKYRVSEVFGSQGENPVATGVQFRFKKMEILAGADAKTTAAGGKQELATVSMVKNETKEVKVQNTYDREDKRVLRIEKTVSGELSNQNQFFPFQLKLKKANGQSITQSDFDALKTSFSAQTKGAISFTASNSAINFNLKHGQALEFILPKDMSFSVGENPSGYLPSVSSGYVLTQVIDAQGFRFTKERKLKDIQGLALVSFRNIKDPISPTGVVDEARPLAMVFTAFILFSGAVAFGMKKKEEG